jgi:hypothetical protein
MKIGKPQGILVLVFGLLLLTGAILVFITVPAWGTWIAGYPDKVSQSQVPAQAAPVVQAVLGIVLGPMIHQVGGYMRVAGFFGGTVMTIMALGVSSMGVMIIRKAES